MSHEESKLQQQCVAWFRAQYPQYAMLLTHPANEGNGNRVTGAIHKAEGTVPGVPDLILFLPSDVNRRLNGVRSDWATTNGLGIELKTAKGRQSQQQKDFQRMFEAAGYGYCIVRSFDHFRVVVHNYMMMVYDGVKETVATAHQQLTEEREQREKEHFYKVIRKK